MKKHALAIFLIISIFLGLTAGCSKKSKKSIASSSNTGSTPTNTGSGTTPPPPPWDGSPAYTDSTVPGNTQIGLSESPEAPSVDGGTADEKMVAQAINEFRQQNGLPALIWSDAIADAERSHAYDCEQQGYFGHGAKSNPGNYNFCTQRGQFLGLPGSLYECGAQGGVANALPSWKNSSSHRAALLQTGLKYHGVGIDSQGHYTFWASLR